MAKTRTRTDLPAQREAALRPLFNHSFDLDFIGRFALGKSWVRATPEQRADYMELFREFVVKTTARRLRGFVGESFTIIRVKEISDGDVLVLSRVERPGESSVAAGWRVRRVGDRHKIVDVSVGGLSLSQAHRREFAALIRRQGLDGLLRMLRTRNDAIEALQETRNPRGDDPA